VSPEQYHRKPSSLCIDPENPFQYIECPVEWPFGAGLSYSTFEYANASLSAHVIDEGTNLHVSLTGWSVPSQSACVAEA
jgi:hypothetical protein